MPFFAWSCAFILAAAAAAAAAGSALFAGLSVVPRAIGLRLRRLSDFLEDGERERRSKRDVRFGSGSVWSKRERFRGSSAMMHLAYKINQGVVEELWSW